MKKIANSLILVLAFIITPWALAEGTANLKINISGASGKYYLCTQDSGCLLILAGKTYPMFQDVNVSQVFLMRKSDHWVMSQASSASCNTTVTANHTVTISGSVSGGANARINNLHCKVS